MATDLPRLATDATAEKDSNEDTSAPYSGIEECVHKNVSGLKSKGCADESGLSRTLPATERKSQDKKGNGSMPKDEITKTKPGEEKDKGQCTISDKIPITGGEVKVKGCSVSFPKGAFDVDSDVTVILEAHNSKLPKGYIGITPTIYVKTSEPLQCPASVTLTTWAAIDGRKPGRKQDVSILHGADENGKSIEWKSIATIPLEKQAVFKFECSDFSPVVGVIFERDADYVVFQSVGYIFADSKCNFHLAFCLNERSMIDNLHTDMERQSSKSFMFLGNTSLRRDDFLKVQILLDSNRNSRQIYNAHSFAADFIWQGQVFVSSFVLDEDYSGRRVKITARVCINGVFDGVSHETNYDEVLPFQP